MIAERRKKRASARGGSEREEKYKANTGESKILLLKVRFDASFRDGI